MHEHYSAAGAGLHSSDEENRDDLDRDLAELFRKVEADEYEIRRQQAAAPISDKDRRQQAEVAALLAELDAMPADEAAGEAADSHPAPAPVSNTGDDDRPPTGLPVAPEESEPDNRDHLTDTEMAALAFAEASAPRAIAPMFDAPMVDAPMFDAPHPIRRMIEDYRSKECERAERRRKAAADHKRARDRIRVAAKREAERTVRAETTAAETARGAAIRDRIKAEADRRLAALLAATSAGKLDKRLAKIKGAERSYVALWIAATAAGVNHAGKPSLSDIAMIASRRFPCDRYKARRMLKVIEGLEASGIWSPFTPT